MGFRRSEYRRRFKEPLWEDHLERYRENVLYRAYRRQLEHHHNFVEWDWDTESEEGRQAGIARSRHAAAKKERTRTVDNDREDVGGRAIAARGLSDRAVQMPDLETAKNGKGSDQGGEGRIIVGHPEVATRQKPRPISAPERGQKAEIGRPPMLAYGWADSKRDVGGKKTFNIRASAHGDHTQVFPAALRAMRRNEYAIRFREEERKRESLKMRRLRAAFNVPPREDGNIWVTEYQRSYTGRPVSR
ncbi:centriole, cilia and spindle-associated protein-like [Diadema setosum]|uniref:centriole, cilia and spindle-associated protein-like n=1 Tax=Diadema setosum TaxID=31175 RepID=UPI003B3A387B